MLVFVKKWWPSILTFSVVLYATLWPDPVGAEEVSLFPGADKLIHAIMMGGLASAVLFDWRRSGRSLSRRFIVSVACVAVLFSALDEIAQNAMNLGRALEFLDFLADTGGIIIASFAAPPVINKIFSKRSVKH